MCLQIKQDFLLFLNSFNCHKISSSISKVNFFFFKQVVTQPQWFFLASTKVQYYDLQLDCDLSSWSFLFHGVGSLNMFLKNSIFFWFIQVIQIIINNETNWYNISPLAFANSEEQYQKILSSSGK